MPADIGCLPVGLLLDELDLLAEAHFFRLATRVVLGEKKVLFADRLLVELREVILVERFARFEALLRVYRKVFYFPV